MLWNVNKKKSLIADRFESVLMTLNDLEMHDAISPVFQRSTKSSQIRHDNTGERRVLGGQPRHLPGLPWIWISMDISMDIFIYFNSND